jgi:translation initiation factor IF-3
MIRIPQVRVVDEEGAQLGVMPTPRALEMAQERGLDLVEVAPMAAPPVVKFLDFGQYKYDLTKREKEAKRKQRSVTFKEVRLSPKIGTGDFDTKVHRAIEFLEDGDRIKVTVRFRGRELTHPEIGRTLLAKFGDAVKDHGVVDRTPVLEGKSMFMTLASVHKPRVHEHRNLGPRPEGEEPEDTGTEIEETVAAQAEPAAAQPEPAATAEPEAPKVKPAEAAKPIAESKPVAEPKAPPAKPAETEKPAAEPAKPAAEPRATAEPKPVAKPAEAAKPVAEPEPVAEPAPVGE